MADETDPAHFELWHMPYSKQHRDRFRDGSLRDAWFAQNQGSCFDEDDLRLATSQPKNHFFEWLAAINLYNAIGLHALVEKYESKKTHPRKFEIFEKLVGPETLKFALDYGTDEYGGTGCPDLLLYQPDQLLRKEVFLVICQLRTFYEIDFVGAVGNQPVNFPNAVAETDSAQFRIQDIGQASESICD